MKLSKILPLIVSTTLFSLLYVYQQTEIFRLAYEGQKQQVHFQELLDRNTLLRYNIESKASLVEIGSNLIQVKDYEMPNTYQLVRTSYAQSSPKLVQQQPKGQNFIARFFSIKREAQAKTVNP